MLENNHLSVEDVLNKDAKNAFLFGGIALIQYDENRNIVWTSDLFKAMNINNNIVVIGDSNFFFFSFFFLAIISSYKLIIFFNFLLNSIRGNMIVLPQLVHFILISAPTLTISNSLVPQG